jgi:hypothetical protein
LYVPLFLVYGNKIFLAESAGLNAENMDVSDSLLPPDVEGGGG